MGKKKLTKAERRAVAMRNLQKAWGARGVKARKTPAKRKTTRRARETFGVAETKKKTTGKAPLTKEQRRSIAMKNLEKAWSSMGTPVAAPAPAARPAAAAAATRPPKAPKPKAKGRPSAKGMVPSGKYFAPQSNAVISIKRGFPKENPVLEWDAPTMGTAAVGALFGVVAA